MRDTSNEKAVNNRVNTIADIYHVITDCRHALQISLQTWLQSIADIPHSKAFNIVAMFHFIAYSGNLVMYAMVIPLSDSPRNPPLARQRIGSV